MLFEERFGAVSLNQSTSGFFYRLIHGRNCSKPSRKCAALKIFLGNGLLQVCCEDLKSDTLLVAKMSANPVYSSPVPRNDPEMSVPSAHPALAGSSKVDCVPLNTTAEEVGRSSKVDCVPLNTTAEEGTQF